MQGPTTHSATQSNRDEEHSPSPLLRKGNNSAGSTAVSDRAKEDLNPGQEEVRIVEGRREDGRRTAQSGERAKRGKLI